VETGSPWRPGKDGPSSEMFGVDLGIAAEGDAFPRAVFGIFLRRGPRSLLHRRSPTCAGVHGLWFLAVRSNERAAAAAGMRRTSREALAFGWPFLAGPGWLPARLSAQRSGEQLRRVRIVGAARHDVFRRHRQRRRRAACRAFARVVCDRGHGQESSRYQFAVNGVALIIVAVLYRRRHQRRRRLVAPSPDRAPVEPAVGTAAPVTLTSSRSPFEPEPVRPVNPSGLR